MARMREIGASFDKGYRDDLNYNFGLLEALIGEANGLTDALRQEMLNYINNLQQQINILTGENIDELLARLNDSIQQALTAAQEARTAKTATEEATALATTATELANASALLAEEKANYANEKAVLAQEAADNANQEASNLSQLKIDVVQATQDANTATGNANQATQAAQTATNAINVVLPNVEGLVNLKEWNTETQYKKNNFVTLEGNGYMALRDNKGVRPPSLPVLSNADWAMFVQKGEKGEQGTGVRILGTLLDESALPSIGEPGDAYLINGDLYVWSDTTNDWTNVGTIKGPKGDMGPQGPEGPQGLPGKDADLTEVNQEIANLQQTVTDNKTEVTEHLEQMKPKVDNSWQKGIENNATITNLSPYVASRVVHFSEWDADNSKLDALFISFPVANFSGTLKLTLVGDFGVGNAMGGAEVYYQIGKVGSTSYSKTKSILTISSSFASSFYIGDAVYQDSRFYIPITKAPQTKNPLAIKIELQSINANAFSIVNSIIVARDSVIAQPYPWTPQMSQFVNVSGGTMIGDLKINKGIPKLTLTPILSTPDATKYFELYYNAAGANNFGVSFDIDQKPAMQILSQKDVRFVGHDNSWFTIQDLKSSVSDGKAAVNQAVTDMGVYTPPDASYATTAANIKAIPKGKAVQESTIIVPAFSGGSYVQVDVVFTGGTARNVTAQCGGRLLIHGMYYGTSAVSNGLFVSNIEVIGSTVRFTFNLGGGLGSWVGGSIRYTI
ncbi:hypothetical protein KQI46_00800, partial [Lysinibacillus capsici]|nr:hypothetical protein [Lysinibacillus capsici]